MRVSAAEFIKAYGALADKAVSEPITITKDGRDSLVLLSAEEYARLRRRERRVFALEELSEQEIEEISRVEPPSDAAAHDAELEGWRP